MQEIGGDGCMTLEEALDRIENLIPQLRCTQIPDQILEEEIEAIRADAQKDLEAEVVGDASPIR
jgi:hypothetical protein